MTHSARFDPHPILDLWFPDDGHWLDRDRHIDFWMTRMQGGMDEIICRDFEDLTVAAAQGMLDHWAESPRGRLALLIALDQFPRSLWRDTPAAYGQDIKACRLALAGLENGHYHALPHIWEREFYVIAISHCEGPDHLQRMDLCVELAKGHAAICPDHMQDVVPQFIAQAERVRGVIARFGRHPHRNPIYGRVSSPEEQAYIDTGDFPHVKSADSVKADMSDG